MKRKKTGQVAIIHYSSAPVIGGVESVIQTHARFFIGAGYPTTIIVGRGEQEAVPHGARLIRIPALDSKHAHVLGLSQELEQGRLPQGFEEMVSQIEETLAPHLNSIDMIIVHNIFTKHFNLPLTAALFRLLERGSMRHCVAWCHDLTWTSPNSRSKVYPGYPWDLLRTYYPGMTYVTVSQQRQRELAELLECEPERIKVIYNGVNPEELFGLSSIGLGLIDQLNLWESDLNLLLPVRVTQAKNIELAIHVIAALKEKGLLPKLVVTGPPDPHDQMNMEYFQSLLALRDQVGVTEQVRFVYESGPVPDEPFFVDMRVVTELLRVSDALFMPSHREGFGMPILEAGLAGIPIFCADSIPAAREIGGQDLIMFSPGAPPTQIADLILRWTEESSVLRLRRRVRQTLTWQSIFRDQILPLLESGDR
ncbi:MAG TPA: glycosyltransferase family 4 protein [Anaerolineales bacterium]|nr:glycosyltransferase family 4 protein [Anaerolineales bacterium]